MPEEKPRDLTLESTASPQTGPSLVAPRVIWRSLRPEEEKDLFGSYAIGRMQFPPSTSAIVSEGPPDPPETTPPVDVDGSDRNLRLRYLSQQLVLWFELKRHTGLEIPRSLMRAAVKMSVPPCEVYSEAWDMAGRDVDFPSYEDVGPPGA